MELKDLSGVEKQAYIHLQRDGAMTKKELQDRMGLKPSTMGRILETLMKSGLIEENVDQSVNSLGRKPYQYDIAHLGKYLLGIDISRIIFSVVLCDFKMKIIDSTELSGIIEYQSAMELIDKTCLLVSEMLERNGISTTDLLGAGVAMVGPVNRHTGCTERVEGFPTDDWSFLPLKDILSEKLGCPVYVDNGAEAAVVYEYIYGLGKKSRSVAFINSGMGIRSGFISSNVLIRSINNNENALEHTVVMPMGRRCFCGKYGCARCYCTTKSVFENIRNWKKGGRSTLIEKEIDEIYFPDVVEAAKNGDVQCRKEISSAGEMFGYTLANYIGILNPEIVIIDGVAISLSDIYYNNAVETARSNLPRDGSVVFYRGGSQKGMTMAVSAAAIVFEKFMNNPMIE